MFNCSTFRICNYFALGFPLATRNIRGIIDLTTKIIERIPPPSSCICFNPILEKVQLDRCNAGYYRLELASGVGK